MSEADINDLRYEALAGRINKVESYLENVVQHITIDDSRHAIDSPPKSAGSRRPLKLRLGLSLLLQAVQDRTYKPRLQMTTRFQLCWIKILVIIKSMMLIMK